MIDDPPSNLDERRNRRQPRPSTDASANAAQPIRLNFHLVAPNQPSHHNTLRSALWVEIKLVTNRLREVDGISIFDERTPIADELCQLFLGDGTIRETRTNDSGVARFNDLPIAIGGASVDDVMRPAIVLPEILEEWVGGEAGGASTAPDGDFGKNLGGRDDYRSRDGCVHFVPVRTPEYEICINHLSEEQKFQHIVQVFRDHGARWGDPTTHDEPTIGNRNCWVWGYGNICNTHVNLFLGYWFNFNRQFTYRRAVGTAVSTLLAYNSSEQHDAALHPAHRGYREFLEPVAQFTAGRQPLDPAVRHPARPQLADQHDSHYLLLGYVPIDSRLFVRSPPATHPQYTPTADGRTLINALSNFNVYSLSSAYRTVSDAQGNVVGRDYDSEIVRILRTNGYPQANVGNASDILWELDPADHDDALALHALENDYVNWDHHGGILVKRGPNGIPPDGVNASQHELWTFSGDGRANNRMSILFKRFDHADLRRWLVRLSIFRLKSLRAGGLSPEDAIRNAGNLSIDEPPRFIDWR